MSQSHEEQVNWVPALLGCCVLAQQTQHGVVLWEKGCSSAHDGELWYPAWEAVGQGITSGWWDAIGESIPAIPVCPYVSRGMAVLGYTEMELCRWGSGYQFVHAADMMYCAENHLRSECWGGTLV